MTDMNKSRFSEEQIIGFIKQAEAGMAIKEICRKGGFSPFVRTPRWSVFGRRQHKVVLVHNHLVFGAKMPIIGMRRQVLPLLLCEACQ
jgi:Transposase